MHLFSPAPHRSGAVQSALDCKAKAILCITSSGRAPALVSKFRPPCPVLVVTPDLQLVRHCRSAYGQIGIHYPKEQEPTPINMAYVQEYCRKMVSGEMSETEDCG
jgi:pyruvate kinase